MSLSETPRQRRAIRLLSRQFTPRRGLGKGLDAHLTQGEERRGVRHVIVQLDETAADNHGRLRGKRSRIRLLDPIPEGAYFAALPPDPSFAARLVERGQPLHWIGVIEPNDKISPQLRDGAVPEHAQREAGVEVVVLFFGDVAQERQRRVLDDLGADVGSPVPELNGWVVVVSQPAIAQLARRDPVKWIEPVPAPMEVDNDGVRSPTGVNADPVHPTVAYGLSGAGITVAQWEGDHASLTHVDFAGRIVVGDPPVAAVERSQKHAESVAANARWDAGEAIYSDMDDSGTVTSGDVRASAVAGFGAGSVVAAGDSDIGTALIFFNPLERFRDTAPTDFLYSDGEAIYRDADGNANSATGTVSVGDTRLSAVGTFAAGSVVAAGDSDVGQVIRSFLTNPHYHATHVAGTVMGSGAGSAAAGGTANQWKGVAPGATLRSYAGSPIFNADYTNAAANGATISTNSWGTSHIHQVSPPNTGYDIGSQLYDAVISGRRSDGTASGLAQRIAIVGSAGNAGYPERHTENVAVNGRFDNGESIYWDLTDDGVVSGADRLLAGPARPIGTPLIDFARDEMHDETAGGLGAFAAAEGIYRDADGSRTVTVGDTRISAAGGFAAGTVVAAGDADAGRLLRPFALWGTIRIPNSAKNTIEVANVSSDTRRLSASSSRGPTDDGRVKPDVAGPGSQNSGDLAVTSTWPGNLYAGITGTSMSTPAVSGVAALVSEWYRTMCAPAPPAPELIRALLIHSAADLATIPVVGTAFAGPDYGNGYGSVRAKEAVDLVPYHIVGTATAVGDTDRTVTIAGGRLKVTLAWADPAWTANAAPSSATGILQNDLDLLLVAPDGRQFTPWLLNPAAPGTPATRAEIAAGTPVPASSRDRRNTVEQVVVDNAMPGMWTIRVTASTLRLAPQPYVLVSEALPVQVGPCATTPAADVWMRDNGGDTGTVPSSGLMWLSPDVWNRVLADGMTAHENPEYGQENYLYANIRNASAAVVRAARIDFYIARAATGLAWPADFTFVGSIDVPNLAPNSDRQVGPLAWNPPSPAPSNHFCFYVRVQSPQDAIAFTETADVGTNASNSNNIVWRNIDIVDLRSSTSVTFLTRNVGKRADDVALEIELPEPLLEAAAVDIRLGRELERRWKQRERPEKELDELDARYFAVSPRRAREDHGVDGGDEGRHDADELSPPARRIRSPKVELTGFVLEPGQAEPVTLTFAAPARLTEEYEVDVIQRIDGQVVGGIRYIVRSSS